MGDVEEKNNGKQLGSLYKTQCWKLMSYFLKALTAARTNCFATKATQGKQRPTVVFEVIENI